MDFRNEFTKSYIMTSLSLMKLDGLRLQLYLALKVSAYIGIQISVLLNLQKKKKMFKTLSSTRRPCQIWFKIESLINIYL